MNITIWKKVLDLTEVQEIEVPADAELITAREQFGRACVWYKCDPDRPMVKRRIQLVGTGHNVPENGRYVGTSFLSDGHLVLHVFEVTGW